MQAGYNAIEQLSLLTLVPIGIRKWIALLSWSKTVLFIDRTPNLIGILACIASEALRILNQVHKHAIIALTVHCAEFIVVRFPSFNQQWI